LICDIDDLGHGAPPFRSLCQVAGLALTRWPVAHFSMEMADV
jgi:hypothetical protein